MAWVSIATISLTNNWNFTLPTVGEWFRVRHSLPNNVSKTGLIAQASTTGGIELLGIRKLYSKSQADIYQFIQPDCWSQRVIAVRGRWMSSKVPWLVSIDVWDEPFAPAGFAITNLSGGSF
jgi:hypothetical protein